MSEIKYGLISKTDAECIEATLNYICNDFNEKYISVTEIGCYGGGSGRGICEYLFSKHRLPIMTGIDNNKDGEKVMFQYDRFIVGNSNEVYNQLPDNTQHFIFIDGLHTFAGVVSDFFCYAPKVKVGGYIAFHDTGKHLDPLSGWQGVGDKNDPDMCLGGVRKALNAIGLLHDKERPSYIMQDNTPEWKLIFDEADISDTGGGVCIFKKIFNKLWD